MLLPVVLLTFLLTSFGSCSKCVVENIYSYRDRTVCYNVASDAVLDIEPDKKASMEYLEIDEKSIVPSLPPNWLSSLENLKELRLSRLEIETLSPGTFAGLKKLKELYLYENKIAEIPPGAFDGMENLKTLNMEHNLLTKISRHYFQNLRSLENLRVSYNQISVIDDDAFADLSQLRNIEFAYNNLMYLPENVFNNLSQLTRVDLQQNPLVQGQNFNVKNTVKIQIIFQDNSLEYFKNNLSEYRVKFLGLANNHLKEFDFANLNEFKCVELSNNTIREIPNLNQLHSVPENHSIGERLEEVIIFLSNNKIKHLDQVTEPLNVHVTILDLSKNEIESASCLGLTHLQFLNLAHNKIGSIKQHNFYFCKELQILNLSSNAIANLDAGAFAEAGSLILLDLSNNNLKEINVNIFSGLKKLSTLRLHENEIVSLDAEELLKDLPELNSVTIYSNPLDNKDKIVEKLEHRNIKLSKDSHEDLVFNTTFFYLLC